MFFNSVKPTHQISKQVKTDMLQDLIDYFENGLFIDGKIDTLRKEDVFVDVMSEIRKMSLFAGRTETSKTTENEKMNGWMM